VPAERTVLVKAELSNNVGAAALWQEAFAWKDRVDVLVNNAAVMREDGDIETDDATWDAV